MNYTAEDFKNANIAVRVTLHAARRAEPDTALPWVYGDSEWDDDKGMVENGWRPVHEHNPHATDALEEEIQDLRDENVRLKARLGILHAELALWQERASQAEAYARKAGAAPLTLDTLREAWESTSVPSVVHVGDTVIQRDHLGESFSVFEAERDYHRPPLDIRVLRRAPQPWQALADVLGDFAIHDTDGEEYPDVLARKLYERGVRVTGGGDDE